MLEVMGYIIDDCCFGDLYFIFNENGKLFVVLEKNGCGKVIVCNI